MSALGVDIGGSSVKAAALERDGSTRVATSGRYDRPSLDELRLAVLDACRALSPHEVRWHAIGVCAPGITDESGMVMRAVNMPCLEGVRLRSLLEGVASPEMPFNLTSDALAAAHDIWRTRSLTGRLLSISIGTGVGACVLDEGRPLHVCGESSGHIGQMDVSWGDVAPIGPDGGRGSLEAYIGAPALRRRLGEGATTLADDDPALIALARTIRICHAVYRPDHVVLLGGIGIRLRSKVEVIRGLVARNLTSLARPGWTLSTGEHDHHAAIGAARLAHAAGTTRAP